MGYTGYMHGFYKCELELSCANDQHPVFCIFVIDGMAKSNAEFGQGNGTIAIENVACTGSENQLLVCPSSPIFGTTCTHDEDAGVVCEGIEPF